MAPRGRQGKATGQRRRGNASGGSGGKPQQSHKSKEPGKGGRQEAGQPGPTANDDPLKAQKKEPIPIQLQQLLLDVFGSAFLSSESCSPGYPLSRNIQTLKAHLYRRDFVSAFADANGELLKAYALRWSAARALGYADIFWNVPETLIRREQPDGGVAASRAESGTQQDQDHIVCIGGGAGAEVVALAAIQRALSDRGEPPASRPCGDVEPTDIARDVSELSLDAGQTKRNAEEDVEARDLSALEAKDTLPPSEVLPDFCVTAVDIADWSPILRDLTNSIRSKSVPSTESYPAPLLARALYGVAEGPFAVNFRHEDILNISDEELKSVLFPTTQAKFSRTSLVTLMFTLNELFSTSMSKTVAFLLRLTDLVEAGTVLLVVDSPGSYSTVSMGATKSSESSLSRPVSSTDAMSTETKSIDCSSAPPKEEQKPPQRTYPMRFLLEHTLLSVAAGQWERVLSDESRWFRRDQSALRYDLGRGIGLEDMRYQIHVYKKLP